MEIDLRVGDSLQVLTELADNSVDSVVTDPPYGLSFMGKKWDYDVPTTELWKEVLRVLKPGGHLLSFSSSRTYHRMTVNVEDAGFEIRDQIMWVYGSGFPKSHNIGKSYDKKVGNDREEGNTITTKNHSGKGRGPNAALAEHPGTIKYTHTKGTSEWEGCGTNLKPSHEPIVLARKPLSEKTVVDNVIKWGTGGINIDKSRVGDNNGRWPANFIHDGSDEVMEGFPEVNKGSAARYFYCAKVSKAERNAGLEEFDEKAPVGRDPGQDEFNVAYKLRTTPRANPHPTVKPVKLMSYLVNLVTPVSGTVLDPFMGSGSTGLACKQEGFDFIGIDLDESYVEIAKARIDGWKN